MVIRSESELLLPCCRVGGKSWEASVVLNGHDAYSYSCLTEVPQPGFVGVAYETVLPGSDIKSSASANNIVFTLVPQNFSRRDASSDPAGANNPTTPP